MFDFDFEKIGTFALLSTFSGILLLLLVQMVRAGRFRLKARPVVSDDWRDPPPLLYLLFKPLVRLFVPAVRGKLPEKTYQRSQIRLSAGGMNYAILPEEFMTLRLLCLAVACLVSASLFISIEGMAPEARLILLVIIPLGYAYPDIWLSDRIKIRRARVEKEFPFLLDLLILSMRAGLNYSTSLAQAVNSLPDGPVREEFAKLLREVRAGKGRRDALLDLARRMNIGAISNFVAALNQADETGGEIVDVLTAQAEQRRVERFNRAEEMANKAPIKMLFPLMVFLFPVIFMLIAFIMIVKFGDSGYLPASITRLL
jgi:tight adherence protein C